MEGYSGFILARVSRFCKTHISDRSELEVLGFVQRNLKRGEKGWKSVVRGYQDLRRRRAMKGLFVVVEGPEAVGKTTLIRGLEASLRDGGVDVRVFREPGGTPLGERVREVLKGDRGKVSISAKAEALLFAASRAELCEMIRKLLSEGAVVILDRFVLSTKLYQGLGRGLGSVVEEVSEFATGGLKPELEVLLIAGEAGLAQRARGRKLDTFEEDDELQRMVKEGYRKVAEEVKGDGRYFVVDTDGKGAEEVLKLVYGRVLGELVGR